MRDVLGSSASAVRMTAPHEADKIMQLAAGKPFTAMATSAWITGFTAGLRVARGTVPPQVKPVSQAEIKKIVFLGVDPASVEWMAQQRGMRIGQAIGVNPDKRTQQMALAAAWLDAVMVGHQFDQAGTSR